MAASFELITLDECADILSALEDLPVTRAWQGASDPSLFLEIGRLRREVFDHPTRGKLVFRNGRATVMIECDWRVEGPRSIQFGSRFGDRRIDHRLKTLIGTRIERIFLEGRLPELVIELDDRRTIRTFTNWTTQPEWHVGFRDGALFDLDEKWSGVDVHPWVKHECGRLCVEFDYDEATVPQGRDGFA
jgi:hypothetical protein